MRDCRGRHRRRAENMPPPKGPTPQRLTRLLIGRDKAFDEPKLEPFYLCGIKSDRRRYLMGEAGSGSGPV